MSNHMMSFAGHYGAMVVPLLCVLGGDIPYCPVPGHNSRTLVGDGTLGVKKFDALCVSPKY
jgi:hypothetical protein